MRQTLLNVSIVDTWYKKIIPLGGVLFLFTVFWEFGFISSYPLSFFAVGLILVGLGELVNHKNLPQRSTYGPTRPKITIRKTEETGILLDAVGLFCFVMGFYLMFSSSF